MNFEPDEDLRLLIDSVQGLARAELAAAAARADAHARPWASLAQRVGELGLAGAELPEAQGGSGISLEAAATVLRTIAAVDASAALRLSAHNVALGLISSVEHPSLSSLRSEAVQGQLWLTWADEGAWVVGRDQASAIVCVRDGALHLAVSTATAPELLGLRSAGLCSGEGIGPGEALGGVSPFDPQVRARLDAAAIACGIAGAALDAAAEYAKARQQFGQPIANFQAIQWKLADAAAQIDAAWLHVLAAAASSTPDPATVARAHVYAVERAVAICSDALQIHGGFGYTRDFPVERFLRDARALASLWGGAHEGRRQVAHRLAERFAE